jgi:hypothetical protein
VCSHSTNILDNHTEDETCVCFTSEMGIVTGMEGNGKSDLYEVLDCSSSSLNTCKSVEKERDNKKH